MPPRHTLLLASSVLVLAACGALPSLTGPKPAPAAKVSPGETAPIPEKAREVVMYALSLLETGYRFGGKNPEAGLDCSGMVSYVYDKAADLRLTGSAAELARRGRPVDPSRLRPGDLVFFNTRNQPYSHVGIYIGDGRFIHAPSSRGRVRTESLREGWFAARFEEGRTYFD